MKLSFLAKKKKKKVKKERFNLLINKVTVCFHAIASRWKGNFTTKESRSLSQHKKNRKTVERKKRKRENINGNKRKLWGIKHEKWVQRISMSCN